jgi:hypothetical protein
LLTPNSGREPIWINDNWIGYINSDGDFSVTQLNCNGAPACDFTLFATENPLGSATLSSDGRWLAMVETFENTNDIVWIVVLDIIDGRPTRMGQWAAFQSPEIRAIDWETGTQDLFIETYTPSTNTQLQEYRCTLLTFNCPLIPDPLLVYIAANPISLEIQVQATATPQASATGNLAVTLTAQAQATGTAQAVIDNMTATANAATLTAQANQCLISPPMAANFLATGGLSSHQNVLIPPRPPSAGNVPRLSHPLDHVNIAPQVVWDIVAGVIPSPRYRRPYSVYWSIPTAMTPSYADFVVSSMFANPIIETAITTWSQPIGGSPRLPGSDTDVLETIPAVITNSVNVMTPNGLRSYLFSNTLGFGFTFDRQTQQVVAMNGMVRHHIIPTLMVPQLSRSKIVIVCNPGFLGGLNYTILTTYPQ